MAGGYDHRFSSALFQRFGLDAELRHLDVAELATLSECGSVDFFLASARSAFYEGGHVVVIDGYRNGVFTVVDPSDPVYRAAARFYPEDVMSHMFNGFGTAIMLSLLEWPLTLLRGIACHQMVSRRIRRALSMRSAQLAADSSSGGDGETLLRAVVGERFLSVHWGFGRPAGLQASPDGDAAVDYVAERDRGGAMPLVCDTSVRGEAGFVGENRRLDAVTEVAGFRRPFPVG
jgi:hypothetical protein